MDPEEHVRRLFQAFDVRCEYQHNAQPQAVSIPRGARRLQGYESFSVRATITPYTIQPCIRRHSPYNTRAAPWWKQELSEPKVQT